MSAAHKPTLYGDRTRWGLVHGDALDLLVKLPAASVHAIVTDPPYGIDFHGEAWDGRDIRKHASGTGAGEAFASWTRSWAREALRVLRPGGFMVAFGAPRTFHRLICGIEDAGFQSRDLLMWLYAQGLPKGRRLSGGRSTALKPAFEAALLARRPPADTVAANLSRWNTGALNIEEAGIGTERYWPPHLALSHAAACQDGRCVLDCPIRLVDDGRSAPLPSRLFFCAKATRREREAGCEQLPLRSVQIFTGKHHPPRWVRNLHPTVKPIALMAWLVRLTCPPGGVVLDPFAGSATTGIAALTEGRQFVGIEREAEYVQVAQARLEHWERQSRSRD